MNWLNLAYLVQLPLLITLDFNYRENLQMISKEVVEPRGNG